MKNIHVLPTDKPSRLFEDDLQLYYSKDKNRIGSIVSNHHIYITSDEEIKVGDWCFYVNSIYKVLRISSNNRPIIKMSDGTFEISYYRKIILTTDQDLIKDGVQAIDDEFLEWFVKNPSCDEVGFSTYHVKGDISGKLHYQIIIPKEEPKQDEIDFMANELVIEKERMYSEEEVLNFTQTMIMQYKFGNNNIEQMDLLKESLEQFKKK